MKKFECNIGAALVGEHGQEKVSRTARNNCFASYHCYNETSSVQTPRRRLNTYPTAGDKPFRIK